MNREIIQKILLVLWGINISLLIFILLGLIGAIGSNTNLYPMLAFMIVYFFIALTLFDFSINDRMFYPRLFVIKRCLIYLFLSFVLVWLSGYFFVIVDLLVGLFSIISFIVSGKKLFSKSITS